MREGAGGPARGAGWHTYLNKFGFGLQRSEALLAANNNPPLDFDVDERGFGVTVWKRR